MRIVHADLEARWVLTDEDAVMPIAGLLDSEGDQTKDAAEAVVVVCQSAYGVPWCFALAAVDGRTVH